MMKTQFVCCGGEEVTEDDMSNLKEEIRIRLLYAIPHLVDRADLERATDSIADLFDNDRAAESQRWQPALEQTWFWIGFDGAIMEDIWRDTPGDQQAWVWGNCFGTRQEAEEVRCKLQEVFVNFHREQGNKLAVAKPKDIA
jgi:hypothetical protein